MKKKTKKLLLSLTAILLTAGILGTPLTASADAPYNTYTIDGYGDVTETQTAYLPYMTITKVGEEALAAPTDFTITKDDLIYILDSGNGRVIVSTLEGEYVKTLCEGYLTTPRGMYVTDDHTIYIADRDAKAIFVFDDDGNLLHTYGKPDHPLYGDSLDFLPLKVVVNSSGTMYVICESNTNGIVQISPVDGGTFLGYFGTNSTSTNLWKIFWRSIQTDAQRAKSKGNIPSTPDNMAIDDKGLLYTVTRGEGDETLKRLNIAGTNMIEPDSYEETPACVAVGNHDNVFVASQQGYIYEYNNEGEMLFVFGGSDDGQNRIGLSTKVEAIQVDNYDRIYVLDSDKAQIQIYEPTEFTHYLHEALYLFSKGRYTESKEPLSEVLKMNNLFDYANMAMGRALYQEEDYNSAIYYAKLAKDFDGYSDAFWEIRNVWLKQNLAWVIALLLILWAVSFTVKKIDKKKHILDKPKAFLKKIGEKKFIAQLRYMFYFMKHPVDGCYGIKRENRVSVGSASLLVFIFTVEMIVYKYFCGFIFKTVREGRYEIVSDIGYVLVAGALIVGCNYLMCTINEGEGKIRDLYCAFAYSLAPYIVIMPFVILLSHGVTYNESFLIRFAMVFMYCWIAILVFISIKEINNYSVKETFKIIALTIFTILIAVLLAFIMYVLWAQVIDFIQQIVGEVVYKIGN